MAKYPDAIRIRISPNDIKNFIFKIEVGFFCYHSGRLSNCKYGRDNFNSSISKYILYWQLFKDIVPLVEFKLSSGINFGQKSFDSCTIVFTFNFHTNI